MGAPLFLAALLLAGCVAAAPESGGERERLMERIEAAIRMPAGASPLASYERIYAYAADGSMVALFQRSARPGRRWADRPVPGANDGGCAFVDVTARPDGTVQRVACHGEA